MRNTELWFKVGVLQGRALNDMSVWMNGGNRKGLSKLTLLGD